MQFLTTCSEYNHVVATICFNSVGSGIPNDVQISSQSVIWGKVHKKGQTSFSLRNARGDMLKRVEKDEIAERKAIGRGTNPPNIQSWSRRMCLPNMLE